MCQLFGLNSAKLISPQFSLSGFFRRGGATDHHTDGWGLAYFERGTRVLYVKDRAAHQCRDVASLLAKGFKASTVIAHVRKATQGAISVENSHPFVRRLWGKEWVFAHNGHLKGFHPPPDSHYPVSGNTDSERAFCYMMTRLSYEFGWSSPSLKELVLFLSELSDEISRYGTFNFLLSDGETLIAHASTQLFWTKRSAPFYAAELIDEEGVRMDFGRHNDEDDRVVAVATRPVTKGEPWFAMGRGELRAFVGGEEMASCFAGIFSWAEPEAGAPETWGSGWQLGRMQIL